MTEESHIRDMLRVRQRSSNTQSDQQQDNQQDQQEQEQQEQGTASAMTSTNTDVSSSQLTSTAGDVTTESRDDDVIADRQRAAGLGVEVFVDSLTSLYRTALSVTLSLSLSHCHNVIQRLQRHQPG